VRVVLDTSAVVSGLLWGGLPGEVFDRVTEGTVEAVTSETLLAELARILTRSKFAAKLAAKQCTGAEIVSLYAQLAQRVEPASLSTIPGLRDPDDQHVLACALAAQADLIISSDPHLLNLKSYQRIPIVSPAEALQRLPQR